MSPRVSLRSTCTTPSLSSWSIALRNCLYLSAVVARSVEKCSGANEGIGGNWTLGPSKRVSPGGQCGRVHQSDHVARICGVDRGAIPAEHGLGVLGGERFSGLRVRDDHAAFELAGHDPHVRQPISVARVHAGLHLEDDGAEGSVTGRSLPSMSRRPAGGGASSTSTSSSCRTPEVQHRRGEDHRRGLAGEEQLLVVVLTHLGEQFALLDGGGPFVAFRAPRRRRRS